MKAVRDFYASFPRVIYQMCAIRRYPQVVWKFDRIFITWTTSNF